MDFVSKTFGVIRDILLTVEQESTTIDKLLEKMTANSSLMRTEVESNTRLARRFGFLEDSDEKISVTVQGKEFVKQMQILRENDTDEKVDVKVVDEASVSITLPPFCNPLPLGIKNNISSTSSTIKRVVSDAENELYIASPFLDLGLLQVCFENVRRKPNATVVILTSERSLLQYKDSTKGNFPLQELGKLLKSRFKSGKVFYMDKDMSISHAKIFCSDKSMLVTSANIKKDSITENFELGIYTERKDLINIVSGLVSFLTESGMADLIYDTRVGVVST